MLAVAQVAAGALWLLKSTQKAQECKFAWARNMLGIIQALSRVGDGVPVPGNVP